MFASERAPSFARKMSESLSLLQVQITFLKPTLAAARRRKIVALPPSSLVAKIPARLPVRIGKTKRSQLTRTWRRKSETYAIAYICWKKLPK